MSKVEVDLARDLFTVTADANHPSDAALIAAVEEEGFQARIVAPGAQPAVSAPVGSDASAQTPALVQEALDLAGRTGRLVLVDFYADWCAPCLRMLRETYVDPEVLLELEHFVFLKVDTDVHPQVSRHYGVAGIPDARVLRPDGTEIVRMTGYQDAVQTLAVLRKARGEYTSNPRPREE